MITGVLFDWGGVLIENPEPGILNAVKRALGARHRDDEFAAIIKRHLSAFQRGLIDEAAFWRRVCPELGVAVPRQPIWGDAMGSTYTERRELFALLDDLRARGLRLGLVSNTEPPCPQHMSRALTSRLDSTTISYEVGAVKPELAIYLAGCQALGTTPPETLFIDDAAANVRGAEQAGLHVAVADTASAVSEAVSNALPNRLS